MKKIPHVLVIDDDQALGKAYTNRLEQEGFYVHLCSEGQKALKQAVDLKPDVILLDLLMPGLSGFDFLDIIRNTPEIKDTKVVIFTALSGPGDKQKAIDLGADDYIVKTHAAVADVVATLRKQLEKPEGD